MKELAKAEILKVVLKKRAECIRQVEKCAWASTPSAGGDGEIKVFGPEAFYGYVLKQECQ